MKTIQKAVLLAVFLFSGYAAFDGPMYFPAVLSPGSATIGGPMCFPGLGCLPPANFK